MLELLWIMLKNLAKSNQCLPTRCKTPVMSGYWPVTDSLIELKTEGVTHYQYMVKVLSGAVELGQVDILLDTALMSTYLVLSCRGNTKQIFHVF